MEVLGDDLLDYPVITWNRLESHREISRLGFSHQYAIAGFALSTWAALETKRAMSADLRAFGMLAAMKAEVGKVYCGPLTARW